jgi:hypothetical protein
VVKNPLFICFSSFFPSNEISFEGISLQRQAKKISMLQKWFLAVLDKLPLILNNIHDSVLVSFHIFHFLFYPLSTVLDVQQEKRKSQRHC